MYNGPRAIASRYGQGLWFSTNRPSSSRARRARRRASRGGDLAWPLLVWFTERIFEEDRWAVEREQQAHDAQGAD
jgi:hypothetical protein